MQGPVDHGTTREPTPVPMPRGSRESDRGVALQASWAYPDMLAGLVAGEANHARKHRRPRQTQLLDRIADQLEDVLAVPGFDAASGSGDS